MVWEEQKGRQRYELESPFQTQAGIRANNTASYVKDKRPVTFVAVPH
jgi:hypothetical protein